MIGENCRPRLMGHNHLFESEDLLLQVLSKLPVKTLFRFKCVCKRWRDLISDSDDHYLFLLHSDHSICKQPLLFCSSVTTSSSSGIPCSAFLETLDKEGETISEFEVKYDISYANVVHTHFDLVCIQDDRIRICNPSTHEMITLPPHPLSVGSSSVGFGYGQSTDKYKVVGLRNPNYYEVEDYEDVDPVSFTTKCYVFTLGIERRDSRCCTSSSFWAWREVEDSPYHVNYAAPPASVNGAIHWLVLYDSLMDEEIFDGDMIDPNNTIVAFDVDSEEFRLISHPKGCPDLKSLQLEYRDYECPELQLVELRGLLSLSCAKGSTMDIWMFKDYYYESNSFFVSGTWVKEYSIDLSVLPKEYQMEGNPFYYYTPRDVDDTEVLIETHMKGWGYYHLQSKRFEGLMHRTEMPKLQFSLYTESLRSLKLFKQLTEMKDEQAKKLEVLEEMSAKLEDLRAICAEREDMKEALARVEDLKAKVASLIHRW